MRVQVNGRAYELEADSTIESLLQHLEVEAPTVAVAVDGKLVPRSEHAHARLHAHAVIEVVRAAGGA